jgi:hypothetical protein
VPIGIKITPTANVLDVIKRVRAALPGIESQLPQGLSLKVAYDSTAFIQGSIDEVEHTLIEAVVIVILVIFAFLGSLRAIFIPIIAIPLSLIGAGIFMLASASHSIFSLCWPWCSPSDWSWMTRLLWWKMSAAIWRWGERPMMPRCWARASWAGRSSPWRWCWWRSMCPSALSAA